MIIKEDFYVTNRTNGRDVHSSRHIAKDWNDFYDSYKPNASGYSDPKYPPTLTKFDYEDYANTLAMSKAGKSSDRQSNIIGFKVEDNGKIRNVKIKKTSPIINKVSSYHKRDINSQIGDCVVYVMENDEPVIISLMCGFTNKLIKKNLSKYVGELDENKVESDSMKIEEGNKYRRLNRTLFGGANDKIKTFAIVSPENPLGWKDSTEEEFKEKFIEWTKNKSKYNKNALNELKTSDLEKYFKKTGDETLKYGAFSYVQLKGSYGDKEKSFFIFNIPFVDAKKIARDYGQESFFFGMVKNGEMQVAYYETNDACKTYQRKEISDVITNEEDAEDYFSKYGLKFRINMNLFGDDVVPLDNEWGFEEDLNEPSTFRHRAKERRTIKKDLDTKLNEYFEDNLNEEIKVNDTLNPKLWDENDELKEDVKERLLDIVDNFLDALKEDNINIEVVDARVLGSNANYNYTDKSDIDLHIVADFNALPCEQNVLPQLYNAYKTLWNSKFDIKIKGQDVEIYVEDVNSPAKSNGVYSLYTGWLSRPNRQEVPEIDYDELDRQFDEWEDRYFKIVGEYSSEEE